MADHASSWQLWTLILIVTALLLALVVTAQIVTAYTAAYMAAPRDISTFVDAVDFSIQENESYDRDVASVQRLEDKMRLGRLLREIQKGGDDLREDLNQLVIAENGTTLRVSARVLWASHKKQLEERVRRLDLLRMRFLVVYMGIVAGSAGERARQAEREREKTTPTKQDPEKATPHNLNNNNNSNHHHHLPRLAIARSLTDGIKQRPPLRRLSTQAMGHSEKTEQPHRTGWLGVVQELQRSPLMHRRHASIEMAMRSPPAMTPIGSPLALSPVDEAHSAKTT